MKLQFYVKSNTDSVILLPRHVRSAKRGIAIVSRPSVCTSLLLSIRYAEVL